jgi:hypothetical protein
MVAATSGPLPAPTTITTIACPSSPLSSTFNHLCSNALQEVEEEWEESEEKEDEEEKEKEWMNKER